MEYKNRCKKYFTVCIAIPIFMLLGIVSFGQTTALIKNSYSFFIERLPGNIRADENGKPFPVKIDTTLIIYIETTRRKINWASIYKNGVAYHIAAQLIVPAPFYAGKLYNNNKIVTITIEKNNFLWQLYLVPEPAQNEKTFFMKQKDFLIKGKYKGNFFLYKVANPIQLTGIPSV